MTRAHKPYKKYKKRVNSPEITKKRQEIGRRVMKLRWENPEFREKMSKEAKERWEDPEYRKIVSEKVSVTVTENWKNEDIRKRTCAALLEANSHKEYNKEQWEKHSQRMKELWENEEYRQRVLTSRSRPEIRNKNVQGMLRTQYSGPNLSEIKLNEILEELFPNEYKFVGVGDFMLEGKCPDFVNINGQKKIIELFGNYWHQNDTGENRIAAFKKYGYETLIIWENELSSSKLKIKLQKFHYKNI